MSYDHKHNEANQEDNRDGTDDNLSWNCGVGGPDRRSARSLALREKQKRNFLATLLLSQGLPMLLAGDELGHTQAGNNNAYCQDNDISWLDWAPLRDGASETFEFVRGTHRAAPQPSRLSARRVSSAASAARRRRSRTSRGTSPAGAR